MAYRRKSVKADETAVQGELLPRVRSRQRSSGNFSNLPRITGDVFELEFD
jgi:hypothetical protein